MTYFLKKIPFILSTILKTLFFKKILTSFMQLWISSLRINFNCSTPCLNNTLIAVWHTDLLIAIATFQKQHFHIMVSASQDGDFLTNICKNRGYTIHRGSTSRRALSGIRSMIKSTSTDNTQKRFCMTLDGPKGPAYKVSKGAHWLSQKLNVPAFIMKTSCSFYFRLPTWDKTIIPLPFSRIEVSLINYFLHL